MKVFFTSQDLLDFAALFSSVEEDLVMYPLMKKSRDFVVCN